MENNKQTAVEWLFTQLDLINLLPREKWIEARKEILEQAKEKEKEQHIKTATHFFPTTLKREHFEHYYKDTYEQ
jgi:hypothetical protein